jgi:hypothetical protein
VDAVKSLVRVPAKGPVEVKHTTCGGFPSWVKVRKTRKVLNEVLYALGSQVPEKGSVTPQCTWGRSLQRRGTRRLSPFPGERHLYRGVRHRCIGGLLIGHHGDGAIFCRNRLQSEEKS